MSVCVNKFYFSKKLDSTTARTHGESLYCKVEKFKHRVKIYSQKKEESDYLETSGMSPQNRAERESEDLRGHNGHQAPGRKGLFYLFV